VPGGHPQPGTAAGSVQYHEGDSDPVLNDAPIAPTPTLARMETTSRSFRARPQSVGEARRYLTALMEGSASAQDAVTCLSEVATNALLHTRSARRRGWFAVTVQRTPAAWRVAVRDAGGPWKPRHANDGTSHRGLFIVAALAARWGIEGNGRTGRAVWFEIADPPQDLQ